MKVIGLDIGTTTLCALLVDSVTGNVLEVEKTENNFAIESPDVWEKLQDPNKILFKAKKLVKSFVKKHTLIDAIGVTGQMHGIVYLDTQGNAVSPLYGWQDGCGNLFFEDGKTYVSYLTEQTGYSLATGYGAVTHFYNIKNGLVPKNAVQFCTIHDYVAMKLAGINEPIIHSSDAASLGMFALPKAEFDYEALKNVGMQVSFFPKVVNRLQILGKNINGIPVVVAIGDNQASYIGSVKDMKNSILVNVGTGSQLSVMSDHFIQNKGIDTRPYMDKSYLLVGASLCGGSAYANLESFFRSVVEMAGFSCDSLYPNMNALSEKFIALEDKLTIATQFSGTREHPQNRGSIQNLGIKNFTPQHFIVGVLEGIVEELYQMYNRIKNLPDFTPTTLIGSGNGIRNSIVMQRMFEDKFGMKMKIPVYQEEAAYGAALTAMVGIGFYDSIESAQKIIQFK
ncbi:MAG: FGGY family carbohydrate kinase [Clostridia bacterium]|nr:FGGY family carbohydrate kinase [Clostridia bacterium]MDD4048363.1 FGGY family carbohydrate kinase [Clostridia bacterium]